MSTPAVGVTSAHATAPFITVPMFKAEPTGLATDNLVAGGTPQQQDAELAKLIRRASGEMNSFCYGSSGGVLHATTDTTTERLRLGKYGRFLLSPRLTPVRALTSFQWGDDMAQLYSLTDLTHVEVEDHRVEVSVFPFTGLTSVGPLQFGVPVSRDFPLRVVYSYVNGWPLTSLTSAAAQGAQTLTVNDATGIYAGNVLTIRDTIAGEETVTVTSVTATTIGCTPLAYAHTPSTTNPVQVDGLPDDFVTACTEITAGLIKRKLAETVSSPKKSQATETGVHPGEENFARGFDCLSAYVQVRTR